MKSRTLWLYLIMITATIGMCVVLGQGSAQAATDCTTVTQANGGGDVDTDGFTNYQECLWNGQALNTAIAPNHKIYGKSYCPCGTAYTCTSGTKTIITNHCLNPDTKDLFLIIMSSSTLFPSDTDIQSYFSSAGLNGINLHFIHPTMNPLTRTVVSGGTQNAIMITESTDTSSTVSGPDLLGFANLGTPNGLDNTTIYTTRIKNFITNTCGSNYYSNSTYCKDTVTPNPNTGDALTKNYILHTIAHEVGHVLGPLAHTYNANYGGNHNATGANYVMDQSIYFTQSGSPKTTTFYIGPRYFSDDLNNVTLK